MVKLIYLDDGHAILMLKLQVLLGLLYSKCDFYFDSRPMRYRGKFHWKGLEQSIYTFYWRGYSEDGFKEAIYILGVFRRLLGEKYRVEKHWVKPKKLDDWEPECARAFNEVGELVYEGPGRNRNIVASG